MKLLQVPEVDKKLYEDGYKCHSAQKKDMRYVLEDHQTKLMIIEVNNGLCC